MPSPAKRKKGGGFWPVMREIFICARKELSPFATVFVFHPENFEQQKLGMLFGILKVDEYSENSSYVVNLLTSVMKKEYYSKLHRSVEESFEASLRKANLALAELARHGSTAWAGKLHFAGGALEQNSLHFTCLGNASVLLIRDSQLADISNELAEEKDAESHPLKTFSNVSSGRLEFGDKLILATSELLDIFSREELRQNAAHFSREEFPGFLEISLEANSELAGAIVVDLAEKADGKAVMPRITPTEREISRSIDSPHAAKDFSAEDSSGTRIETSVPALRAYGGKILHFTKYALRNVLVFYQKAASGIRRSLRGSVLKDRIKKPPSFAVFHKSRSVAKKSASAVSKTVSGILHFAQNYYSWKTGVAAIAVVLAISAIFIFKNRASQQPEIAADSSSQNAEQITAIQPLEDINMKNIENLEEIAAFPQSPSHVTILGEALYAISGKNKSLMRVELPNKNTEELASSLNTGNFVLIAAMPDLNALFILTQDNKIVSFTPINKNFQENNISLPSGLKAADIKTYLTYIYFLDPAANQIYRYPRSEGGFGEMQNWLRSGADVKSAKSFAINDDLFTAGENEPTAYLQGHRDEKINFEKPSVPLSIDRVYSEPGMEGIYALDNKNHRVVSFSKEGKITAQFWNADISGIKDFVADEKNKSVYLAKEDKILKLSTE